MHVADSVKAYLGALSYAPDTVRASDAERLASALSCSCLVLPTGATVLEGRLLILQYLGQLKRLGLFPGLPEVLQAQRSSSQLSQYLLQITW